MAFTEEFAFTLPKGYMDKDGVIHKQGTMRLATAADEILPMRDPRVQQNPAYVQLIILARVITSLGSVSSITTETIEGLYTADMKYLSGFYQEINGNGKPVISVVCPACGKEFEAEA